ncbi:hypothetical protein T08_12620 [Trichinella sp. T8]|nr:hypothetical protein T08_12620 [Trichinella sp. T8]
MVKGVEQFSTDNDPNGTKPWIKAAALRSTEPGHHYTADRSFKWSAARLRETHSVTMEPHQGRPAFLTNPFSPLLHTNFAFDSSICRGALTCANDPKMPTASEVIWPPASFDQWSVDQARQTTQFRAEKLH